jgi:hypothetical protein
MSRSSEKVIGYDACEFCGMPSDKVSVDGFPDNEFRYRHKGNSRRRCPGSLYPAERERVRRLRLGPMLREALEREKGALPRPRWWPVRWSW